MSSSEFKRKATKGMIWTAIQKYSTMIINLISGIILARLLEPEDYGCVGMLAIFITIAEICIDAGFGSALIQKKNPTQVDYSTVFFFNFGISAIMYLILYLSSPYIANFYHMPILSNVLRVQGLILFIYALNIIQLNQLKKTFKFRQIAIATILASIVGLAVTIFLAFRQFGVWALVAQYLIVGAVPMLFYWISSRWVPSFVFSWESVKNLFSFGGYMFLSNLLNRIGAQINGLLIGRMYNPATMGYFSKAQSTERLASTSISSIMAQVTYPLYAAKQDNKDELSNIIRRITMTISYITTPVLMMLCLVAKPIFVVLYSEKWLPCVPYFQLLCFAGMAVCLHSVNNQALAAIGKSKVMFKWTLIKKLVEIFLIIIGIILGGVNGLLIAMIIDNWFIYFVNANNVSKHIGYSITDQLKSLFPIYSITILACLISYGFVNAFNLSLFVDGITKTFVFILIYLGWSIIFKPEAYKYSLSIIKLLQKKKSQIA